MIEQTGIAVCGSVKLNRKDMPSKDCLEEAGVDTMSRGDTIYLQSENRNVLFWKDQQILRLLFNHRNVNEKLLPIERWWGEGRRSTMHVHPAIIDYFKHARYVDVVNQLHFSYPIHRQSRNASSSFLWWLIDMCVINAFVLYRISYPTVKHLAFRRLLVSQLVDAHIANRSLSPKRKQPHTTVYLAHLHFSAHSDDARDCKHCSHRPHNRTRTHYYCPACSVHLCIGDCFRIYHTPT
jgi:hypothetical protein